MFLFRDANPSPPSSAVGHERVELYLYSPYGPYGLYRASMPVQGWPLLLPYIQSEYILYFSHVNKEITYIQDETEYNCQIAVRSCDRIFSNFSNYY